ncbi:YczE/YyaS/YitT family protein, partial [Megamonas funiformis]|uniref:YczE/YyaS/YitT family protein n=1 Tax=Megamonas funiformis TaxID=437897 RepID=UPI0022E71721
QVSFVSKNPLHLGMGSMSKVPMTFIFCAFIDLFMYIFSWLHPQAYYQHILVLLIGCICMGIGVTCQLLGRVVMLPGEGLVNAIATHWKLDFGKIKVIFDWSLVAIAGGLSLYYFGTIEGIREGTLVLAFATGLLVKFFMNMLLKFRVKRFGQLRQQYKMEKLKSKGNKV